MVRAIMDFAVVVMVVMVVQMCITMVSMRLGLAPGGVVVPGLVEAAGDEQGLRP